MDMASDIVLKRRARLIARGVLGEMRCRLGRVLTPVAIALALHRAKIACMVYKKAGGIAV